jgi:hypothetical protein
MSIFKNKLAKFFGTAWDNEYEITLANNLMQYREKILQSEADGQQFIQAFAEANADLLELCSPEFKEAIYKMGLYMTESDGYTGVWEDVSLKIVNKLGMKVMPDEIRKIKAIALNKFGFKINERDTKPVEEVVVFRIPIVQLVKFEKEIKRINPELMANIVDLNAVNLNIAPRVNRLNKEKTMQEMDTSDIAVYDAPIALYRRRLAEYDPYGTATNKKNKDEKAIVKTAFERIREAIQVIDLDKMEVVASNINEDVEFAKVIIKEGGKERTVKLLKEMVIEYLVDHGHVSDYMDWNGNFDLRSYLKARPKFVVNQVFRECIERTLMVLTEAAIEDQSGDYNEWKAKVATKTGNAYHIQRADNDSLNTQALDGQDNVIGEWDPNKMIGYIYK